MSVNRRESWADQIEELELIQALVGQLLSNMIDEVVAGSQGNAEGTDRNENSLIDRKVIAPWPQGTEFKVRIQTNRMESLKGIIEKVNREDINELKEENIEAYQTIAKDLWSRFSDYNEVLVGDLSTEVMEHPYFSEDFYGQGESIYMQVVEELGRTLAIIKSKKRHQMSPEKSSSNLERISIPEFNGRYAEWRTFHDLFHSHVHAKEDMSEVDKMTRLLNALKGPAKDLVSNVGKGAANYQTAWAKLVARYENPRLIMAAHLNRILALTEIQDKTASGLFRIIDSVTEPLAALKILGAPTEHWDIIICHIVRRVIDAKTREDWEVKLGDSTDPPKLEEFMEFLKARARAWENVEREGLTGAPKVTPTEKQKSTARVHQGSSSGRSTDSPRDRSTQSRVSQPSNKATCSVCKGAHWIGPDCIKFIGMRPVERKQFLETNGLCYNCMGPHRATKCKSKYRCKTCQGLHHTLIHLSTGGASAGDAARAESVPADVHASGDNGAIIKSKNVIKRDPVNESSGPSSSQDTASHGNSSQWTIIERKKSTASQNIRDNQQVERHQQSEKYQVGDHRQSEKYQVGDHRQSEEYQVGHHPHVQATLNGDHRQSEQQEAHHQRDQHQSEPNQVDPVDIINVLEVQQLQHQGTQLVVLATARVNALNHHGYSKPARILIDQGSEISLVSEHLVNQLHLERRSSSLTIIGIGETSTGNTRGVVTLDLQPRHNPAVQINVTAHILSKLTAKIPSFKCEASVPIQLRELQLADRKFLQPGAIDIIIGADSYGKIIEEKIIRFDDTNLIAQLTIFGWVISGAVCCTSCAPKSSYRIATQTANKNLLDLMKRFWLQEELPEPSSSAMSKAEAECEQHFVETHQRDASGRYIVRLPFKSSTIALGDTASTAKVRLQKLIKRLSSDSEAHTLYKNFIEEYEALDHMQRAPMNSEPKQAYYLPHHGVLKPDSTTTKLRVVFDASHRSSSGVSLNDVLHPGPKLQVDSSDVLIWLRRHRWVFGADIVKMFRQIRVHHDDWDYQRIFWKDDEGQIIEYQLTTVTYGTNCAPWLSLRVLKQLAIDEGHRFPLALPTFTKGRYVDDIYGGAETEQQMEEIIKQLIDLCMAGGMPLQKWCSNSPKTLEHLGISSGSATSIEFEKSIVKVLGLCWQPHTDTFHYKAKDFNKEIITKRVILSEIAQIYDPLGLIAPVIVTAKIIMQELWLLKLNWDDPIPMTQAKRWQKFREELHQLSSISIPRWLHLSPEITEIQLHGFADASNLAMGAAVFLRTSSATSGSNASLVCAKTKVAPLKKMTIPRLELTAAVMVTDLVDYVRRTLELENVETYLWSDSSVAIAWIRGDPSRWKDYVQNRVLKIKDTLPSATWRHINGRENPADCASRGLSPRELGEHHLWWTGPQWLVLSKQEWEASSMELSSNTELSPEAAQEARPQVFSSYPVRIAAADALINRYSSLTKLLRVTAWLGRLVARCRREQLPDSLILQPQELERARLYWVKYTQQLYFEGELNILRAGNALAANHRMSTLTPYMENDVMRLGGRLRKSTLDPEEKNPIILPRHSPLSSLIIADAHQRSFHGGTQLTLAHIRQKYWIIGGRAPVRSHIIKCVTCARYRALRAQQLMGQLPQRRVTPSRVFLHSGVDFAGPINVLRWRGSGSSRTMYKAYICVFVCLATSAVHLELVTDLTSEGFIAAYRRFTSRRGICATLTSDRGLNFVGAEKEMRTLFDQASRESAIIRDKLASDGTQWKFIPPHSPHMGGKWEAAVKSTKYHLRRIIGTSTLTYEEFTTLLTQVEAILNSRPLCPLTNDPQDTAALTPGHFITGGALTTIPEPSILQLNTERLTRWQLISQKVQNFWEHWERECIHRYQQIYKWRQPMNDIKVGSLVLITDERDPPAKWPLARVIELQPGQDNLTRVVKLRTGNHELQRAIHRLVPLPINDDLLEGQQ